MNARNYPGTRRLYKDSENGIILGVCAGIANFFDCKVLTVRVMAVISLLVS